MALVRGPELDVTLVYEARAQMENCVLGNGMRLISTILVAVVVAQLPQGAPAADACRCPIQRG